MRYLQSGLCASCHVFYIAHRLHRLPIEVRRGNQMQLSLINRSTVECRGLSSRIILFQRF